MCLQIIYLSPPERARPAAWAPREAFLFYSHKTLDYFQLSFSLPENLMTSLGGLILVARARQHPEAIAT